MPLLMEKVESGRPEKTCKVASSEAVTVRIDRVGRRKGAQIDGIQADASTQSRSIGQSYPR